VLEISHQVLQADTASAAITMGGGRLDVGDMLNTKAGAGWQVSHFSLDCFPDPDTDIESIGEPFGIFADGNLSLQIKSVRLVNNPGEAGCAP